MTSIGRKTFGRVPLAVQGRDRWEAQGPAHWSDEGEVQKILQPFVAQMANALKDVVARNAALGASEYLAIGEVTLVPGEQGDVLIGLKIDNGEASLIAYVPFKKLIVAALEDVRPVLGVNPQAQALLSQLIGLGRQLASLGHVDQRPVPPKAAHAAE